MAQLKQGTLPKNFSVNEKYSVMLFIQQGSNAETYRVKGKDGKLYFLKLFNYFNFEITEFGTTADCCLISL
jgi:transitional endoplasmic reticulum ATPase